MRWETLIIGERFCKYYQASLPRDCQWLHVQLDWIIPWMGWIEKNSISPETLTVAISLIIVELTPVQNVLVFCTNVHLLKETIYYLQVYISNITKLSPETNWRNSHCRPGQINLVFRSIDPIRIVTYGVEIKCTLWINMERNE